jgi:hypothetical protein
LVFNDTRGVVRDQEVHRGSGLRRATVNAVGDGSFDTRSGAGISHCRPWRWVYLAVLLTIFVVLLITQFKLTAIGHFSAIFIELLLYPLTRQRPRSVTAGSRSRS